MNQTQAQQIRPANDFAAPAQGMGLEGQCAEIEVGREPAQPLGERLGGKSERV